MHFFDVLDPIRTMQVKVLNTKIKFRHSFANLFLFKMIFHFNIFAICILASLEWSFVESRHGYPHFRHQYRHNSRSRFMARLKSLGAAKVEQLREGKLTINRVLPPGFAVIDGEVMDVSYKLIQRKWQGGTAYFAYNDRTQQFPLYTRPSNEMGYHFIVFQDPFYWRGSGHLILLKKVLGVNSNNVPYVGRSNLLFDAYVLSLRATLHPQVDVYNSDFFVQLKIKRDFIRHFNERRYEKTGKRQPFQIRDRRGNRGRRKRSTGMKPKTLHINLKWKSEGECVLKPLNVSRALLRAVKHSKLKQSKSFKEKNFGASSSININISVSLQAKAENNSATHLLYH